MTNNVSNLGQLLDNNARLRDIRYQLNTLQIQMATGKKSQLLSGLGGDGISTQRTRVDINQINVFQSNISTGQARLRQSLQTMQEFMEQAKNMADTMAGEMQQGDVNIGTVKNFAASTLGYLRELINTQDEDRYLLAGADSSTKPLTDTGAHSTYVQNLLQDWRAGTITTDTLISSYSTTPETTMGYSAPLASDQVRNVYVRADVSTDIDYTLTADSDGFKDILNAMTLMANMDLDKVALEEGDNPATVRTAPGATPEDQKDNFFSAFEDMVKRINNGIGKLRLEEQRLQRADLLMGTTADNHTMDLNTLQNALDRLENADPAEVAVKITALQTQLTSAYQVTALLGSLSLAQFLD